MGGLGFEPRLLERNFSSLDHPEGPWDALNFPSFRDKEVET
jgi:hypothetical protein